MNNPTTNKDSSSSIDAVTTIKDWIPVEEFCARFPNIPEKTIRWQLTCRHNNGLGIHVRLIGKRRFISIHGYASWLDASFGAVLGSQGASK